MRKKTDLSAHKYASEGGRVIDSWRIDGAGMSLGNCSQVWKMIL